MESQVDETAGYRINTEFSDAPEGVQTRAQIDQQLRGPQTKEKNQITTW
jgi:hypothetical protein